MNDNASIDEILMLADLWVNLGGISKRNTSLSNNNWYYPVNNLYRTSKEFNWMREYEFIDIHSIDVRVRDINGTNQSMISMYNSCLLSYKIGDNSNIYHYSNYRRRTINGIEYSDNYKIKFCSRINCDCDCYTCEQLNTIQAQIFTADPLIARISDETAFGRTCDENTGGRIIMRPINARLNRLAIEFDTSHLIAIK
jgi:hypothetical protein